MTNPTRQEIIDAYETLDMLLGFSEDRNPDLVPERRRIIEKALPPKPQPTMAEIDWDDEKHYLAEAETPELGKVVMLHPAPDMQILCLRKLYGPYRAYRFPSARLTPTGKRYMLTEVQE